MALFTLRVILIVFIMLERHDKNIGTFFFLIICSYRMDNDLEINYILLHPICFIT